MLTLLGTLLEDKHKNDIVTKITEQCKCDAAVINFNRGCERTAQHQMEAKIAL